MLELKFWLFPIFCQIVFYWRKNNKIFCSFFFLKSLDLMFLCWKKCRDWICGIFFIYMLIFHWQSLESLKVRKIKLIKFNEPSKSCFRAIHWDEIKDFSQKETKFSHNGEEKRQLRFFVAPIKINISKLNYRRGHLFGSTNFICRYQKRNRTLTIFHKLTLLSWLFCVLT